ncbi:MAG: cag pathogenicity island protein Cag26 [Desulfobacterales bacterium]|nr:cag pathogenicity island protein Cag26 [Desulfobacterales bacterium]
MVFLINIFKKYFKLFSHENLLRLTLIVITVIFAGAYGLTYFEPKYKFVDALWWSFVTITTVGYGDIFPVTSGGRFIAIVVMLLGIGLLSVLTATIAAVFIERKIRDKKGMDMSFSTNHYIICGWNFKGVEVIAELRADPKCINDHIVIIADIEEKPIDDPHIDFIAGTINVENLEKANIPEAKSVIVLSDDKLDSHSRDARTILSTMTINSVNPNVYICVELLDQENMEHCKIAGANEIIVVGELSTNLLVNASLDHGISRVITELVSRRYGNELYKMKVPSYIVGKTFFDVVCELKKEQNIICLGVEDFDGNNLVTNPDNSYIIEKDTNLVVISENRPEDLVH